MLRCCEKATANRADLRECVVVGGRLVDAG